MRSLISVAGLALAACATPVAHKDAKPIPAARLLAYQAPVADGGKIVVTRDAGFAGAGCTIALLINGALATTFEVSETASFNVPTGETTLTTSQRGGMCGRTSTTRETVVKTGQVKSFRVYPLIDGMTDIVRAD